MFTLSWYPCQKLNKSSLHLKQMDWGIYVHMTHGNDHNFYLKNQKKKSQYNHFGPLFYHHSMWIWYQIYTFLNVNFFTIICSSLSFHGKFINAEIKSVKTGGEQKQKQKLLFCWRKPARSFLRLTVNKLKAVSQTSFLEHVPPAIHPCLGEESGFCVLWSFMILNQHFCCCSTLAIFCICAITMW